jgi:hypothetical protein
VCPYCEKKKAVLYLGNSGLACRKCYRLCYSIENKTKSNRAIDGTFKVNQKIGCDGAIDDLVFKPKGMHWKTFRKLLAKRGNYSQTFYSGVCLFINRRFGLGVKV